MKLVTYNIQYGRGRDGKFDLPRIADDIAGADVVALQEVERFWRRSGFVDQPAMLAELLGMPHWVYGAGIDLHLEPGGESVPAGSRRQFGNMLLSRTPLRWARNHLLPKHASTGPMSLQRSALEGVIDTAIGGLRVYSVHLTHLTAQTRLPQIQRLLTIHADACREGAPIACGDISEEWVDAGLPQAMPREALFMGDFNMAPGSPEYELMVGPNSSYGGRLSNPEGLVDAWTACGHEESSGNTTASSSRAPVRLDYCFLSTALSPRLRSAPH